MAVHSARPRLLARPCYLAPPAPARSARLSAWSPSTPWSTSPGPGEISATFGLVAVYTLVHVAAFVVAGIVFVALAEQVERVPAMALLVLLTAILLEGLVLATIGVGAQWVLGTVGWLSVAVANALAVLVMGWQVWRTHPMLQRRLLEHPQLRV